MAKKRISDYHFDETKTYLITAERNEPGFPKDDNVEYTIKQDGYNVICHPKDKRYLNLLFIDDHFNWLLYTKRITIKE